MLFDWPSPLYPAFPFPAMVTIWSTFLTRWLNESFETKTSYSNSLFLNSPWTTRQRVDHDQPWKTKTLLSNDKRMMSIGLHNLSTSNFVQSFTIIGITNGPTNYRNKFNSLQGADVPQEKSEIHLAGQVSKQWQSWSTLVIDNIYTAPL